VELELQESLSQIEAVQQEAASLQSVKEEVKANSEALGIKETELTQLKQSIDKQTEDVS
jgi:hypothetical protein